MLSSVATQLDLGILISANLNLNDKCNLRASKATKAFYLIKRNVLNLCCKVKKAKRV